MLIPAVIRLRGLFLLPSPPERPPERCGQGRFFAPCRLYFDIYLKKKKKKIELFRNDDDSFFVSFPLFCVRTVPPVGGEFIA